MSAWLACSMLTEDPGARGSFLMLDLCLSHSERPLICSRHRHGEAMTLRPKAVCIFVGNHHGHILLRPDG